MTIVTLASQFAPADRAPAPILTLQTRRFLQISPLEQALLNAVPDILMVLNPQRQIIFASRSLQTMLGINEEALVGLRPGEALGCMHAGEEAGGCGTAEFCSACGTVKVILDSLAGAHTSKDCRITRMDGDALDLRVSGTPLTLDGEPFAIVVLSDISHEMRRKTLERIFFHDILNTATALRVAANLMARGDVDNPEEWQETLGQLTESLIEEIAAQRQLVAAENDDLAVAFAPVSACSLLQTVVRIYGRYQRDRNRIDLVLPPHDVELISDQTLLQRVIGNMLKNAIEASCRGETITLGYETPDSTHIAFYVHNPTSMPREVQLQVFQRSFSTKGTGRGVGTYSMQLLSERYLKGRITFTSTPEEGTTFRAIYPLHRPARL
jgi:nitrogen fixation/metabolism regulation signal transduction histidine kinase